MKDFTMVGLGEEWSALIILRPNTAVVMVTKHSRQIPSVI